MIDLVCAERQLAPNCYPKQRERVGDSRYQRESIPGTRIEGSPTPLHTQTRAPQLKARVALVADGQEIRSHPATSLNPRCFALSYLLINVAKGLIKYEHKL